MSRRRLIGFGVATAAVIVLASWSVSGFLGVRAMQREITGAEQEIASLRTQAQSLARIIEQLRNDPAYIEKLAREEHGLVREGETVLKFPPKPK
jgi:cell division protein FtsB